MRLTETELEDCISQASTPIEMHSEWSGLHLTVARYVSSHPAATIDDIAERTFRGTKYVHSTETPPIHNPDMLSGTDREYLQWQSDAALSEEWRKLIQRVIEEIS